MGQVADPRRTGHRRGLGDVIQGRLGRDGDPVARPWTSLGFKARVQVLATSEDQTANTWDPMLEMIRGSDLLVDDYGLDVKETFVSFDRGRMEFATSAGDSREGGRPVFAVLDQTEAWRTGNGGVKLAAAVRRNLTKTQGTSIESPNAYAPGDKSVAEKSSPPSTCSRSAGQPEVEGQGHHPPRPPRRPRDHRHLRRGVAAQRPGGGLRRQRRRQRRLGRPRARARGLLGPRQRGRGLQALLPQPDHPASRLLALRARARRHQGRHEGRRGRREDHPGFDGARGRKARRHRRHRAHRLRVSDGHIFEPFPTSVWGAAPEWPKNKVWSPPAAEIEAAVAAAFRKWNVVGFYADPAMWESYLAKWESKWGPKLLVKASAKHPIHWWMTGQRSGPKIAALKRFKDAVLDHELTYDGGLWLTSHFLNARMVPKANGVDIDKKTPEAAEKIDAAIAAVLATRPASTPLRPAP